MTPCKGYSPDCPHLLCHTVGICCEDELRDEDETEPWPSRSEDERLDDPRRGQAKDINR